ncbi:hypothetical protein SKAU_G00022780 [Synaphobranchus kaupii]|uniref:Uncharacterized protein n=1 Tax=Synaphobranchus kaupii TaxID=118154 RepID=A0A9Q1GC78_SYNKA|nr:hypothetical protein SKAU_G00022780 [Synaphobranchus kaupii]
MGVKRNGKEARKKWQDYCSLAKKKGAACLKQPSSPARVGRRRKGFSRICGCSQDLIELEREKLEVLKDLGKVTVEVIQKTLRFQEEVSFSKGAKVM